MAEKEKRKGKGVPAGLLIVGAAAAAAAALYFATRAKAAPPTPQPGLANLYGNVTDASTGKAIPGVLVSLNGWSTLTDASGYYAFLDVAPGAYTATFSKENYETAVY
jgi:hypothetical protein